MAILSSHELFFLSLYNLSDMNIHSHFKGKIKEVPIFALLGNLEVNPRANHPLKEVLLFPLY